jgi:hypothetical protein
LHSKHLLQGSREKLRAKSLPQQVYEDLLEKELRRFGDDAEGEGKTGGAVQQSTRAHHHSGQRPGDDKFTFVSTQLGHISHLERSTLSPRTRVMCKTAPSSLSCW